MKIVIHRGGREIGGNCVEMINGNEHILLDVGLPISNPNLDGCIKENSKYNAVFISHAHLDHYGLLHRISKETPVFCSAAAKDILDINHLFTFQQKYHLNFSIFQSYQTIKVGNFEITPFLQDHSAFDSHGFFIKVEDKRLIYTGDFRNHGRKPFIYKKLLDLIGDQKIDLLLTEGTTLSRDYEKVKTEDDLVNDLIEEISKSDGLSMVCFSPQNIDRLVSIYKASRKTGKTFVIDIYSAYLLSQLSQYANLPQSQYKNVFVYYPRGQIKMLLDKKRQDILEMFKNKRIFKDKILANPHQYVMLMRSSMLDEFKEVDTSLLIYSMWRGYLKKEDTLEMQEWCKKKNVKFQYIHTSGHATVDFIEKFIQEINPISLKILHTEGISVHYPHLLKYQSECVQNGEELII